MPETLTFGSAAAIVTALSFSPTPVSVTEFLSAPNAETSFANYQNTKSIRWNFVSSSISEQIGSTFSNTYTGKHGFIVAKVSLATESGQADPLDDDDFLYE